MGHTIFFLGLGTHSPLLVRGACEALPSLFAPHTSLGLELKDDQASERVQRSQGEAAIEKWGFPGGREGIFEMSILNEKHNESLLRLIPVKI